MKHCLITSPVVKKCNFHDRPDVPLGLRKRPILLQVTVVTKWRILRIAWNMV